MPIIPPAKRASLLDCGQVRKWQPTCNKRGTRSSATTSASPKTQPRGGAHARSPTDGEALYLLGSTLLFEGRFQEALGPLTDAAARAAAQGASATGSATATSRSAIRRAPSGCCAAKRRPTRIRRMRTTRSASVLASQARQRRGTGLRSSPPCATTSCHGEASSNAGNALRALARDEEALPYLRSGVTAQPGSADVHMNLGLVLHSLRRYEEAAASFERAVALAPQLPYALGAQVWVVAVRCPTGSEIGPRIEALRAQVRAAQTPGAPFSSCSRSSDSPAEYPPGRLSCTSGYGRRRKRARPLLRAARGGRSRPRIGYFSSTSTSTPPRILMAKVFEQHDRARFEIIAFSFGPTTEARCARGSTGLRPLRRRARTSDRRGARADARAARSTSPSISRATRGGAPGHLRAPRRRRSRSTISAIPARWARRYIDYVIADHIVIPAERQAHSTPRRSSACPTRYQPNDASAPIAARRPRARECRPARATVSCSAASTTATRSRRRCSTSGCACSSAVPRQRAVAAARTTPRRDAQSAPRGRERAASIRRGSCSRRACALAGASGAAAAGRSVPRHAALQRAHDGERRAVGGPAGADLPGQHFAGRVAASLLRAGGLPELITRDSADYEALAVGLATRTRGARGAPRASWRETAPARRCSTPRVSAALEPAYGRMWEIHQRGEAPRPFSA